MRSVDRKVDHLILLVGDNPLPNAVAGQLLVKDGGRITLVHSAETVGIAIRLRTWLLNKQTIINHVDLQQVAPTNADDIYNKVSQLVKTNECTGLNYTGGTKAMAVHAHRAVRPKTDLANLSYLDPYTLHMRFDDKSEQDVSNLPSVKFELEHDLMALHKSVIIDPDQQPDQRAMLPKTAKALAKAQTINGFSNRWNRWYGNSSYYDKKQEKRVRVGNLYPHNTGKGNLHPVTGRHQNWVDEATLRATSIPFPPFIDAVMKQELGYRADQTTFNIGDAYDIASQPLANRPWVEDLCGWFKGQWLEHYTFACLDALRGKFDFHSILLNINTKEFATSKYKAFEIDVIAIRGYQLFAFSCSTTSNHSSLKLKLFEAFIRAHQLGGDEARVALISASKRSSVLEDGMKSTIDPRIKVFGIQHLATLQQDLVDWIATQI